MGVAVGVTVVGVDEGMTTGGGVFTVAGTTVVGAGVGVVTVGEMAEKASRSRLTRLIPSNAMVTTWRPAGNEMGQPL